MSKPNRTILRSIYVHGRPAAHPNRYRILSAIAPRYLPADFWLPWLEAAHPSIWRKGLSLLGCAMKFPDLKSWHLLIGDGPQPLLPLLRLLGRLSDEQLIVPYMAGEYAYFVATGYYGRWRTRFHRRFFRLWHGYLSISPLMTRLLKTILPPRRHKDIIEIRNFFRIERIGLTKIQPCLESRRIVFIGSGSEEFRVHYKGLDLLFAAVEKALKEEPQLECVVIGKWTPAIQKNLAFRYPLAYERSQWVGWVEDFTSLLESCGLGVQCGRGDAFPNALLEMGLAGLPVLVSEWTGGAHIIQSIEPELVASLNPTDIARRILFYFSLPPSRRREMGSWLRHIILTEYNEVKARSILRERLRVFLDQTPLRHLDLPVWEEPSATLALLRDQGYSL
ncbi:MAG: glycosyltransferase [Bacteroidia bacterium]|nr:glycosyltransferase [Bacteroidia bacterium]